MILERDLVVVVGAVRLEQDVHGQLKCCSNYCLHYGFVIRRFRLTVAPHFLLQRDLPLLCMHVCVRVCMCAQSILISARSECSTV